MTLTSDGDMTITDELELWGSSAVVFEATPNAAGVFLGSRFGLLNEKE